MTGLLTLVAALVVLYAIPAVALWVRGKTRPAAEREAIERAEAEAAALSYRSHVRAPDGELRPRCKIGECEGPATRRRFKIIRDEGWIDFVRRRFGAPARFRVVEDTWSEPRYCDSHAHAVEAEFIMTLIAVQLEIACHIRDAENELGHFERSAVELRVAESTKRAGSQDAPNRRRNEGQPPKA